MYSCVPDNLKNGPRYISGSCVTLTSIVTSNLPNIAVFPDMSSNHQVLIIIEANSELRLFKQCSVRIQAAGLVIHEQVSSKVLDDVDEVVVELGLAISNRHMLYVKSVVNVW